MAKRNIMFPTVQQFRGYAKKAGLSIQKVWESFQLQLTEDPRRHSVVIRGPKGAITVRLRRESTKVKKQVFGGAELGIHDGQHVPEMELERREETGTTAEPGIGDIVDHTNISDMSPPAIRRSVYHHEETTPKTEAGYRNVDVHPDVMAMLKKHIGDRQSGRLFESRNGTPLVVGNVNRFVLKPLLQKLGLPVGTTHAFRHGAVSRFQEAGVHGDLIKKWVGHTSLKMTSRYTHFSMKHRKDEVKRLGSIAC